MSKSQPAHRSAFGVFRSITTRWMDNDVYGHVNNVTYYSYFDTAVNGFLIDQGLLDIGCGKAIGLVVDTGCSYFASIAFPDEIEIGFKVARLGNSSVRYELGVFRKGEDIAVAQGHFVHVYVDRETRQPIGLEKRARAILEAVSPAAG